MRKDIKKILNPALVEKWNKNKNGSLGGIVFSKGDLVSRTRRHKTTKKNICVKS